ncbi:hypothetical protein BT63DRAFT_470346 [Microthyrium microscopicum]|uniref:Uncharacterized protein n=1 Tax=Microthyrium microscopicum TaxID=703497 RepID=A0A6A6UES0_9PEZI|nr:hypothetical protein BT63DRAFT_470346 [Microthyrium microscopicum]
MAPKQTPSHFAELTSLPIRQRKVRQNKELAQMTLPIHTRPSKSQLIQQDCGKNSTSRHVARQYRQKRSTKPSPVAGQRQKRSTEHWKVVHLVAAQQEFLFEAIAHLLHPLPKVLNQYYNVPVISSEEEAPGTITALQDDLEYGAIVELYYSDSSAHPNELLMMELQNYINEAQQQISSAAEFFELEMSQFPPLGSQDEIDISFSQLSLSNAESGISRPISSKELQAVEYALQTVKRDTNTMAATLVVEQCHAREVFDCVHYIKERFQTNGIWPSLHGNETPEQTEFFRYLYIKMSKISKGSSPYNTGVPVDPVEVLSIAAFSRPKLWDVWKDIICKLVGYAHAIEKTIDKWLASELNGWTLPGPIAGTDDAIAADDGDTEMM